MLLAYWWQDLKEILEPLYRKTYVRVEGEGILHHLKLWVLHREHLCFGGLYSMSQTLLLGPHTIGIQSKTLTIDSKHGKTHWLLCLKIKESDHNECEESRQGS